jgi:hypothetical protein
MNAGLPTVLAHSWLLLVHQLPAKPAYLRVKIWRRLQGIGAVAVKNAVHALPMNEETQEDFEWLLREIQKGGGEAFICEARLIDGLSDEDVRTLFDQARDADYGEVARDARVLAKAVRPNAKSEAVADARAQVARLRKRLAEIVAVDFFGTIGRETAEGVLEDLEARLHGDDAVTNKSKVDSAASSMASLRNRTWVTREGVYVDRIASAWLIRRFIDPEARFKFVSGKGYRPSEGELRFDMFKAEFTHEGDKCTFEVLLERGGLKDTALQAIAEIIHDIDLKDGKFGRTEVAGIRTLIEGIRAGTKGDAERIARGTEVLNDPYEYFRKRRRQDVAWSEIFPPLHRRISMVGSAPRKRLRWWTCGVPPILPKRASLSFLRFILTPMMSRNGRRSFLAGKWLCTACMVIRSAKASRRRSALQASMRFTWRVALPVGWPGTSRRAERLAPSPGSG